MQYSQIPVKFNIPFAEAAGGGFITYPIPENSQIGIVNGAASLTDGFVPLNFQPVGAGGVPPFGKDFNGLLKQVTAWTRWQCAGGTPRWDSAFSTAIGGYPIGAILSSAAAGGLWLCVADNNTTNPDLGGAGWIPILGTLLANQEYYVNAATGSDTNNGTSALTPWATLQRAADEIPIYNLNGYDLTINVADGSYASVELPKINGSGTVYWVGNPTTPANVVVTGLNASAILARRVSGVYSFDGFTVASSGSAAGDPCGGVTATGYGTTISLANMRYGACTAGCVIGSQGAVIGMSGTMANTGNVTAGGGLDGSIVFLTTNSILQTGTAISTWTITAAISIAGSFINANIGSYSALAITSVVNPGNLTGRKYRAELNGIISTGGGGAGYYPGTVAGSVATQGQYV